MIIFYLLTFMQIVQVEDVKRTVRQLLLSVMIFLFYFQQIKPITLY